MAAATIRTCTVSARNITGRTQAHHQLALPRARSAFQHARQRRASGTSMFFGNLFGGGKGEGAAGVRSTKRGCELAPTTPPEGLEIATVAGGCFWGLELAFQRVPGVMHTSVGYTAGQVPNPTYEEVCSGRTGHAEAVQMYYDPSEVSYEQLLDVFFQRVDTTTLNRQGNDMGTQYRSAIYYHSEAQKAAAEKAIEEVNRQLEAGTFRRVAGKKVVATVDPATDYYIAEDYHQQYLSKGGRGGRAQSAAKGATDPIRCYG